LDLTDRVKATPGALVSESTRGAMNLIRRLFRHRAEPATQPAATTPVTPRDRLSDIIEVMPNGIALFDRDGRLVLHNARFASFLPSIRTPIAPGIALDDILSAVAETRASARTPRRIADGMIRIADGRWLQMNQHRTAAGETLVIWTDVTATKENERMLHAAKEAAEQASRAKTRFLAAASHDLRQPVTALGLWLEVLLNTVRDKEAIPALHRLRDSVDALSGSLAAMLELSQLEAGLTIPHIGRVALRPLLESLWAEFETLAEAKGLQLRCVAGDAMVQTDPQLLRRILSNLLTNAIKYTSRGKILLGCRRSSAGVRVEIWDTGIGIPASELETIFEEFTQLSQDRRSDSPGLGLGLSIVRRLAELLGHRVYVRSAVDKGSVFGIELPEAGRGAEDPARKAPERADIRFADRTGLVIDDDESVAESIAAVLRSWGCRTLTAASPGAAVLRLSESKSIPDFIVSDYRFKSDINGVDAITWIRAHTRRAIPAVIATADTAPDTVRQIVRSGNALLLKPVRPNDLKHVVLGLLRRGQQS